MLFTIVVDVEDHFAVAEIALLGFEPGLWDPRGGRPCQQQRISAFGKLRRERSRLHSSGGTGCIAAEGNIGHGPSLKAYP